MTDVLCSQQQVVTLDTFVRTPSQRMANTYHFKKMDVSVLRSPEALSEGVENPIILKDFLTTVIAGVRTLADGGVTDTNIDLGHVNAAATLLDKAVLATTILRHLAPVYPVLGARFVSNGKVYLEGIDTVHDNLARIRQAMPVETLVADARPVTDLCTIGLYDPFYDMDAAVSILSRRGPEHGCSFPFFARPLLALQERAATYERVVRPRYDAEAFALVNRMLINDVVPSGMRVGCVGHRVYMQDATVQGSLLYEAGPDADTLQPPRLQLGSLAIRAERHALLVRSGVFVNLFALARRVQVLLDRLSIAGPSQDQDQHAPTFNLYAVQVHYHAALALSILSAWRERVADALLSGAGIGPEPGQGPGAGTGTGASPPFAGNCHVFAANFTAEDTLTLFGDILHDLVRLSKLPAPAHASVAARAQQRARLLKQLSRPVVAVLYKIPQEQAQRYRADFRASHYVLLSELSAYALSNEHRAAFEDLVLFTSAKGPASLAQKVAAFGRMGKARSDFLVGFFRVALQPPYGLVQLPMVRVGIDPGDARDAGAAGAAGAALPREILFDDSDGDSDACGNNAPPPGEQRECALLQYLHLLDERVNNTAHDCMASIHGALLSMPLVTEAFPVTVDEYTSLGARLLTRIAVRLSERPLISLEVRSTKDQSFETLLVYDGSDIRPIVDMTLSGGVYEEPAVDSGTLDSVLRHLSDLLTSRAQTVAPAVSQVSQVPRALQTPPALPTYAIPEPEAKSFHDTLSPENLSADLPPLRFGTAAAVPRDHAVRNVLKQLRVACLMSLFASKVPGTRFLLACAECKMSKKASGDLALFNPTRAFIRHWLPCFAGIFFLPAGAHSMYVSCCYWVLPDGSTDTQMNLVFVHSAELARKAVAHTRGDALRLSQSCVIHTFPIEGNFLRAIRCTGHAHESMSSMYGCFNLFDPDAYTSVQGPCMRKLRHLACTMDTRLWTKALKSIMPVVVDSVQPIVAQYRDIVDADARGADFVHTLDLSTVLVDVYPFSGGTTSSAPGLPSRLSVELRGGRLVVILHVSLCDGEFTSEYLLYNDVPSYSRLLATLAPLRGILLKEALVCALDMHRQDSVPCDMAVATATSPNAPPVFDVRFISTDDRFYFLYNLLQSPLLTVLRLPGGGLMHLNPASLMALTMANDTFAAGGFFTVDDAVTGQYAPDDTRVLLEELERLRTALTIIHRDTYNPSSLRKAVFSFRFPFEKTALFPPDLDSPQYAGWFVSQALDRYGTIIDALPASVKGAASLQTALRSGERYTSLKSAIAGGGADPVRASRVGAALQEYGIENLYSVADYVAVGIAFTAQELFKTTVSTSIKVDFSLGRALNSDISNYKKHSNAQVMDAWGNIFFVLRDYCQFHLPPVFADCLSPYICAGPARTSDDAVVSPKLDDVLARVLDFITARVQTAAFAARLALLPLGGGTDTRGAPDGAGAKAEAALQLFSRSDYRLEHPRQTTSRCDGLIYLRSVSSELRTCINSAPHWTYYLSSFIGGNPGGLLNDVSWKTPDSQSDVIRLRTFLHLEQDIRRNPYLTLAITLGLPNKASEGSCVRSMYATYGNTTLAAYHGLQRHEVHSFSQSQLSLFRYNKPFGAFFDFQPFLLTGTYTENPRTTGTLVLSNVMFRHYNNELKYGTYLTNGIAFFLSGQRGKASADAPRGFLIKPVFEYATHRAYAGSILHECEHILQRVRKHSALLSGVLGELQNLYSRNESTLLEYQRSVKTICNFLGCSGVHIGYFLKFYAAKLQGHPSTIRRGHLTAVKVLSYDQQAYEYASHQLSLEPIEGAFGAPETQGVSPQRELLPLGVAHFSSLLTGNHTIAQLNMLQTPESQTAMIPLVIASYMRSLASLSTILTFIRENVDVFCDRVAQSSIQFGTRQLERSRIILDTFYLIIKLGSQSATFGFSSSPTSLPANGQLDSGLSVRVVCDVSGKVTGRASVYALLNKAVSPAEQQDVRAYALRFGQTLTMVVLNH